MIVVTGSAFLGFLFIFIILKTAFQESFREYMDSDYGEKGSLPFFATLPGMFIIPVVIMFLTDKLNLPIWFLVIGFIVYFIWFVHAVFKAKKGGF